MFVSDIYLQWEINFCIKFKFMKSMSEKRQITNLEMMSINKVFFFLSLLFIFF